jgi:energy-coupling factor transport system ATP-binding protein
VFWVRLQNKPIVEAAALTWFVAGASQPLLSELTFTINRGERVLVTGPSGSGKSTLLRAIAGVLQQTEAGKFSGELYVRGRCGLVLQDPANSFVASQIGGEVAFGPENLALNESEIRRRVDRGLSNVALNYDLRRNATALSGGESQRLALAGVLALDPEVLLLDEPLSMLDAQSATDCGEAIREALLKAPSTTLIVVEHEAAKWADVVSRVISLAADGTISNDEPIDAFMARASRVVSEPIGGFDLTYTAAAKPARITALVGRSGSGKTTELLRQLSQFTAAEVGWVPQQAEFTIVANTVWQSAIATAKNLGLETGLAQRLLVELGLHEKLEQNPYHLSGGELRRLALVSALAHHPSHLILDEPTVGQDAETWRTVAGVILAAKRAGVSVTVATHDAKLIALADEVIKVEPTDSVQPAAAREGRVAPLAALAISLALLIASFAITSLQLGLTALAAEAVLVAGFWRWLPQQRGKRFVPILIALVSIWLSNALFAASGFGTAGFERASVVTLRVAFFALPSVVLAGALRPVELSAALVRWCRVPARPAAAAAAALSRLELLQWQWHNLRQTRRLRGFSGGRGPVARTREFVASLFALLVQALRSAGDLAVAMQARGFGEETAKARTWVKF